MAITQYQRRLLHSQEYQGYGGIRRASKDLGIPYVDAYFELGIKPKGYATWAEYQRSRWQKHSRQKKYRRLGIAIRRCLKRLKKNQNWLAKTINESRQIISNYANSKTVPQKGGVVRKIEKALGLAPKSLEQLIQEG